MKRRRFTEEQIIGILREHEAGDVARKQGISEATLYNWKAKFGGWTFPMRAGCRLWKTRTASDSNLTQFSPSRISRASIINSGSKQFGPCHPSNTTLD